MVCIGSSFVGMIGVKRKKGKKGWVPKRIRSFEMESGTVTITCNNETKKTLPLNKYHTAMVAEIKEVAKENE